MVRVKDISKDWREAGALMAGINLYSFWDEHAFLTKTGDLGSVLKIGGVDYESLDHAGWDDVTKRLEAAFRSLDERTRLYQIFFRHNGAKVPHAEYRDRLVRAAVEQRAEHLKARANQLYSIEMYWVVLVEGAYTRSNVLHALSQLRRDARGSLKELRALVSGNRQRTMLADEIERNRLVLAGTVQSLIGQLSDLTRIELSRAEETFRLFRRLVNLCPAKFEGAKLDGYRQLDWQVAGSEIEAHRRHLRIDDRYVRVLTLKELPSGCAITNSVNWPSPIAGVRLTEIGARPRVSLPRYSLEAIVQTTNSTAVYSKRITSTKKIFLLWYDSAHIST